MTYNTFSRLAARSVDQRGRHRTRRDDAAYPLAATKRLERNAAKWLPAALVLLTTSSAMGQAALTKDAAVETPVEIASPEAADASAPRLFSLGEFHVLDVRQTENETVDVRFSLFLALPPEATEAMLQGLQRRLHRLRNQVIIAVRLTDTTAFVEPGLDRMLQIMRIRINRELGGNLIEALYVNDFVYGDN